MFRVPIEINRLAYKGTLDAALDLARVDNDAGLVATMAFMPAVSTDWPRQGGGLQGRTPCCTNTIA